VQLSVYVVVVVGLTESEPEVPDGEKLVPLQEVALVELHVRVEELPLLMVVGFAEIFTVGGALATLKATEALPDILPAVSLHFT
jgi:hypothetical protein